MRIRIDWECWVETIITTIIALIVATTLTFGLIYCLHLAGVKFKSDNNQCPCKCVCTEVKDVE